MAPPRPPSSRSSLAVCRTFVEQPAQRAGVQTEEGGTRGGHVKNEGPRHVYVFTLLHVFILLLFFLFLIFSSFFFFFSFFSFFFFFFFFSSFFFFFSFFFFYFPVYMQKISWKRSWCYLVCKRYWDDLPPHLVSTVPLRAYRHCYRAAYPGPRHGTRLLSPTVMELFLSVSALFWWPKAASKAKDELAQVRTSPSSTSHHVAGVIACAGPREGDKGLRGDIKQHSGLGNARQV